MNESIVLIVIVVILLLVNLVSLYMINRGKNNSGEDTEDKASEAAQEAETREKMYQQMLLFQQQMTKTLNENFTNSRDSIDKRLNDSNTLMQKQFMTTAEIIKNVTEKITNLENTNKQVVNVSNDLKTLQNILMNPKQRGVVGEYYLNSTLDNILPVTSWQSQYRIDDGKVVDAVIFLDKKVLPIDAKFSLENYNRMIEAPSDSPERKTYEKAVEHDLKTRIDETAKYVDEKLGTMQFAFMFIPSEALYYDLVINKVGVGETSRDLVEYAYRDKHVIIVSPTTLVAYLQTVLQGLRALQIQENAEEIKKQVSKLESHITKYDEYLKKLGNNLSKTVGSYNDAAKNFDLLDTDIVKITGSEKTITREIVDKPAVE
jgi:DNA recombination protein RmuC